MLHDDLSDRPGHSSPQGNGGGRPHTSAERPNLDGAKSAGDDSPGSCGDAPHPPAPRTCGTILLAAFGALVAISALLLTLPVGGDENDGKTDGADKKHEKVCGASSHTKAGICNPYNLPQSSAGKLICFQETGFGDWVLTGSEIDEQGLCTLIYERTWHRIYKNQFDVPLPADALDDISENPGKYERSPDLSRPTEEDLKKRETCRSSSAHSHKTAQLPQRRGGVGPVDNRRLSDFVCGGLGSDSDKGSAAGSGGPPPPPTSVPLPPVEPATGRNQDEFDTIRANWRLYVREAFEHFLMFNLYEFFGLPRDATRRPDLSLAPRGRLDDPMGDDHADTSSRRHPDHKDHETCGELGCWTRDGRWITDNGGHWDDGYYHFPDGRCFDPAKANFQPSSEPNRESLPAGVVCKQDEDAMLWASLRARARLFKEIVGTLYDCAFPRDPTKLPPLPDGRRGSGGVIDDVPPAAPQREGTRAFDEQRFDRDLADLKFKVLLVRLRYAYGEALDSVAGWIEGELHRGGFFVELIPGALIEWFYELSHNEPRDETPQIRKVDALALYSAGSTRQAVSIGRLTSAHIGWANFSMPDDNGVLAASLVRPSADTTSATVISAAAALSPAPSASVHVSAAPAAAANTSVETGVLSTGGGSYERP